MLLSQLLSLKMLLLLLAVTKTGTITLAIGVAVVAHSIATEAGSYVEAASIYCTFSVWKVCCTIALK